MPDAVETAEKSASVESAPHGLQQNIKMNLLKWLNEGRDPYAIIYELALYLEKASAEPGFADVVKKNIQSVYGAGLLSAAVLSDELLAVRERLAKLHSAIDACADDETRTRLKFAAEHHAAKIKELEQKLHSGNQS